MNTNKLTKLWALNHVGLVALTASLGACTTVSDPGAYETCTPVAPATTCGDDTTVEVK